MKLVRRTADPVQFRERDGETATETRTINSDQAARAERVRAEGEDPKMTMARDLLVKFLGEVRGEEAVTMLFDHVDRDSSGEINVKEFKKFLKQQDVGNFATRGIIADKAVDFMNGGSGDSLTRENVASFLDLVGLGGPTTG